MGFLFSLVILPCDESHQGSHISSHLYQWECNRKRSWQTGSGNISHLVTGLFDANIKMQQKISFWWEAKAVVSQKAITPKACVHTEMIWVLLGLDYNCHGWARTPWLFNANRREGRRLLESLDLKSVWAGEKLAHFHGLALESMCVAFESALTLR